MVACRYDRRAVVWSIADGMKSMLERHGQAWKGAAMQCGTVPETAMKHLKIATYKPVTKPSLSGSEVTNGRTYLKRDI